MCRSQSWLAHAVDDVGGLPGPRRSDAAVSDLSMAQVADQLALAVGKQWNDEAAIRRLNDP